MHWSYFLTFDFLKKVYTNTQDSWTKWLEDLNLSMNIDVVYEHLHVAYVGQWFLVAFVAVSFLGQIVDVALSVPDSLVAFLAVAFCRSACSLRSWRCSGISCCLLRRSFSRLPCNPSSCCSGLSCLFTVA